MLFVSFLCFLFLIYLVSSSEYEGTEDLQILSLNHETPRLEDFFWTGSGDGPPPPPDPVTFPEEPSTPIVRTTTVLATVYLDSYSPQAVTDKTTGECIFNCGEPTIPNSLESDIPDDRRYWLLTVIQGSTPDSLQLRLARLYQKAFLRQQERHLGIIKSLDAPTPRKKHEVHSFVVNKDTNLNQIVPYSSNTHSPLKYLDIESSIVSLEEATTSIVTEINSPTEILTGISNMTVTKFFPADMELVATLLPDDKALRITATTVRGTEWILATPTDPETIMKKREVTDREMSEENGKLIDIPLEEDIVNETLLFKREIIKPEQQPPVQVHIQNITETPDTGKVQIVYIVMVGGRAVPAAVAARDMRLVRDAEVAKELGAVVTTKAEPAYLKAAEGLEGEAISTGVGGTELWALAVGGTVAVLILIVLLVLLCLAHRKKSLKSAASLRAYRNELMREIERSQMKQVHEEKDGRLISVVSPSKTRPSSTLLPIYRTASASGSSTTSCEVTEVQTVRRRPKKPHALRMPQKKRGTTDSLLEAAGVESSDSQASGLQTPTSYLSMPSVTSFPRGNLVEPLSKILEPVSVRHLDIDSPVTSLKNQEKPHESKDRPVNQGHKDVIPRRQMASQLVRLGSIDKDPGVIGPLVWDLHCQRIKDHPSKPSTPSNSLASLHKEPSRMRQRFNELMDDAYTLFGSTSSPDDIKGLRKEQTVTQARNDNVRLPGSPYTALDTVRGKSAGLNRDATVIEESTRPRTSAPRPRFQRGPPAKAWGTSPPHSLGPFDRLPPAPTVNPAYLLAEGRLAPEDPALPLITAIKSEIQRVRENAQRNN